MKNVIENKIAKLFKGNILRVFFTTVTDKTKQSGDRKYRQYSIFDLIGWVRKEKKMYSGYVCEATELKLGTSSNII